jgi:hypothetical protein
MMSKQNADDGAFTKFIKKGAYGAYYMVMTKKRMDQQEIMNANPDINLARELWNILDSKLIQKGMEIIMPSIKLNKKIYIPMIDTILTRDNVGTLPPFSTYRGKDV